MRTTLSLLHLGLAALPLAGCGGRGAPDAPGDSGLTDSGRGADSSAHSGHGGMDSGDTGAPADRPTEGTRTLRVHVTLDGQPAGGVTVLQGGGAVRWSTDAGGDAVVTVDYGIPGRDFVIAASPDARTAGEEVTPDTPEPLEIALTRYDPTDNLDYEFQDPGEGDPHIATTAQCNHCHITIAAAWFESPHRTSARNVAVQDLYQGVAFGWDSVAACLSNGGSWELLTDPETRRRRPGCHVGAAVLDTGTTGACADCHAPGIDGELGGRDLLDASDRAWRYGVHCDVCHRVDRVEPDAAPGVAGRLVLMRPSEPSPSPALGTWAPLTFGPFLDVLNPRMGSVPREDLFHSADLCGGCHESDQGALVPDGVVDPARWPTGRFPVHTTWSEWQASPMNPAAPCQSCHMPPDASVGNAADLYNEVVPIDDAHLDASVGWERPPGSVRRHAFYGPRQPESGMLQLAAWVDVDKVVEDGVLRATVTVENVGPGHAIPTGEPLRALLLGVSARCGHTALPATDGPALPDWAGAVASAEAGEDWTVWPDAQPGDTLRVVRRTGDWLDYEGYGPFGDGRFLPEDKGLPEELVVGEVTVTAVHDGVVETDAPLPEGDVAWLTRGAGLAGAPGFGFARVLAGADGARMVPHFLAVDVVSDNRLLPQQAWSGTWTFPTPCDDPLVDASLVHRNLPFALAAERGWAVVDQVMAEVSR